MIEPQINEEKTKDPLYPYITPDDYFKTVKAQIMDRISEEAMAPKTKELRGIARLRPYLYAAAVVIGILVTIYAWDSSVGFPFSNNRIDNISTTDMSDDEFQQFLLDDTSEDYWSLFFSVEDQSITSYR